MCPASSSRSGDLIGCLGGGGGAAFDVALFLLGVGGAVFCCANLPASASGGGALKRGPCGEGARGGEGDGDGGRCEVAGPPFRGGGGAGGGPLFPPLPPVVCGEMSLTRGTNAPGGGGGGARALRSLSAASVAFCCSRYCLMKPACSSIWSSVMPMPSRSSRTFRTAGSVKSTVV